MLRKTRQCGSDLKTLISRAPPLLRDRAGVPGEAQLEPPAQIARQFQHPLPFRENDDFDVLVVAAFLEDFFQLLDFGAGALLGVQDVIGVADHAHHVQMAQQLVLFRLGQRTAFGDGSQPGHDAFMVVIFALLFRAQGDEIIAVGAFRQFGFNVGFAAAQHGRV